MNNWNKNIIVTVLLDPAFGIWQEDFFMVLQWYNNIWVVPVLFLKSVRVRVVDFVDDFFMKVHIKKIACAKFQPLISFLIPAGIFLNPDFDLFLASFQKILKGWNFNKMRSVRSHFFCLSSNFKKKNTLIWNDDLGFIGDLWYGHCISSFLDHL